MWFTSKQRTRRTLSSCRPRLEHLENRVVLDAGFLPTDPRDGLPLIGQIDAPRDLGPQITYDSLEREVLVSGTLSNDTVEVNFTGHALEVRIDSPTGSAMRLFDFTLKPQVLKIRFLGFAGEDTFHNNTSLASYVEGGPGTDHLYGGSGSDTFFGGEEPDYLFGNGGDDFLSGEGGYDTVNGGAGKDTLYWYSGDGRDVLDGGSEDDTVKVYGSNSARDDFTITPGIMDTNRLYVGMLAPDYTSLDIGTVESLKVYGQGYADKFRIYDLHTVANLRSVRLYGGGGQDKFYLDESLDVPQSTFPDVNPGNVLLPKITVPNLHIHGGSSSDWLRYDSWSTNVSVDLAAGSATGTSRISGIERVQGGAGNDTLTGNSAANYLYGGEGQDHLFGGGGNDHLKGQGDADTVDGGADEDTLYWYSGDGRDVLDGGSETDRLKIYGSNSARDVFYIAPGIMDANRLYVGMTAPDITALDIGTVENVDIDSRGKDDEFNISSLNTASVHAVSLLGGSGNDTFDLDDGLVVPYLGIDGGTGADWLDYGSWSTGVFVNLDSTHASSVNRIVSLECVQGGQGDDFIWGQSTNVSNTLYGGGGNDYLYGGPGDDYLHGGGGHDALLGWEGWDTLDGGTGADRFLVAPSQGAFTIRNWDPDDVSVTFQDGQDHTRESNGQQVFFPARSWSEEDIRRVDGAFAVLVNRMQSNVLLRTSGGYEMTFQCYGTGTVVATGAISSIGGWNNGAGTIAFTDTRFDDLTDYTIHRVVYHEIGHNWDDEGALWSDFLAINGWTHVQPSSAEIANYTQTQKYGETWWYRTEDSGFARDYGNDHPVEDFATCFAMYFLDQEGRTWQDNHVGELDIRGNLTADGQATLDSKLDLIDRLLTDHV